jgi:hypothetical protein
VSPVTSQQITHAHTLYCQLTGQRVSLGFDRERAWFELLRADYTLEDLRRVVRYLQREIREGRRNVGALKLSNLLQLDRFEEDLNISRVRLYSSTLASKSPILPEPPSLSESERQAARKRALELLQELRRQHGL